MIIAALLPLWSMAAPPDAAPRRVAIVVGSNAAPPQRAPLRYAHRDAEQVASTLVEVAGWDPDDVALLLEPSPHALRTALQQVEDAELVLFYYSGHGDQGKLFPNGQALSMRAIQADLEATGAALRLGVLDACRGGGWTGSKGLVPTTEFALPDAARSSGTVYVAASSGYEDAHEAEVLEGSFFTHHWTQGLRGAADASADGLVTLEESFDYARAQTIRDSTLLADETQHPSFHIDLRGRAPLVLADLRTAHTTLSLSFRRGTVTVHGVETGARLAVLRPREEGYRLNLAPGEYLLRRVLAGGVQVARVELAAGSSLAVDEVDFHTTAGGPVAKKHGGFAVRSGLAPAKGAGVAQVGVMPGAGNTVLETALHVQLGLTNHVSVDLMGPALALRAGRPHRIEVQSVTGVLDPRASVGYSLAGRLSPRVSWLIGQALQVRASVTPRTAFEAQAWVGRDFSFVDGGFDRGAWRISGAVGVDAQIASRVTIHPGVRYAWSGPPWPEIGSVVERGNRRLPLLRAHVSDQVSVDAYTSGYLDVTGPRFLWVRVGLGLTVAWPGRAQS